MNETEKRPSHEARLVVVLETVTVYLWFLLDGFWLLEWRAATYACSLVCLAFCLSIFAVLDRRPVLMWMASADTAWLCTNIAWAVGDLGPWPEMLFFAKIFFFAGAILFTIALYVGKTHAEFAELILRRMRLLAIFSRR